jgi:hypothetical protein
MRKVQLRDGLKKSELLKGKIGSEQTTNKTNQE